MPGRESGALARSVEAREAELLDRGRRGWPGIDVPLHEFLEHLRRHVRAGAAQGRSPDELLELVHAEDLYLALACARGDRLAIARFEAHVLPLARKALVRWDPAFALVEEVEQLLRQKLLVPVGGAAAKIADYSGRGSLAKWVRAAAIRTAVTLQRGRREVAVDDEAIAEWSTPLSDPELDFIKKRYRAEFSGAFREALHALSAQERNVLRLHLLDGLNIDQIGQLYKAHRSTIARWIAASRQTLLEETRRLLGERLKLNRAELESLIGLLRSQLDVSINRFLARGPE